MSDLGDARCGRSTSVPIVACPTFAPLDAEAREARLRESVNLTIGWLDALVENVNLTPFLRREAERYRDRLSEALSGGE